MTVNIRPAVGDNIMQRVSLVLSVGLEGCRKSGAGVAMRPYVIL